MNKTGVGLITTGLVATLATVANADYNSLVKAATTLPKTFEVGSIYGGRMFNTDSLGVLPFSVIDSTYRTTKADSVVADGGAYFAPGAVKAPGLQQTAVSNDSVAYWDYISFGRLPLTGVEGSSLENEIKRATGLKTWPNPIRAGQKINTNQKGPMEWYNNVGQKVVNPDGTGTYLLKQNGGVAKVVVIN